MFILSRQIWTKCIRSTGEGTSEEKDPTLHAHSWSAGPHLTETAGRLITDVTGLPLTELIWRNSETWASRQTRCFSTVSWGFRYSWTLCVVGWQVVPDVSKYPDAFIFKVIRLNPWRWRHCDLRNVGNHTPKGVTSVTFQKTECSATPLWEGIPSQAVSS
jgi:hypothetical protein